MSFRWLFSRTVRQVNDLCHRVEKILNAQQDLLTPDSVQVVRTLIQELRTATVSADAIVLQKEASRLEAAASKWLKPYPHATIRENVDVALVALVIALGIRTFFLQPMAIPSGSMQPTLFGVTQQDLSRDPKAKVPGFPVRLFDAVARGIWYYDVTAEEDGELKPVLPPEPVLFPFIKKQEFTVGSRTYTVWLPPDELERRAGLHRGEVFHKGQSIMRLKVISGDRLFADRFTYNFRRPERGDIIIFASKDLPDLTPDTHYIKRLVGLPGETLRVMNDRHLSVNGRELDASTPHFENLYSFQGPPRVDHFSGHVNGTVGAGVGMTGMAPLFPDERTTMHIPPHELVAMGDNTMNSYDSRYWGSFPENRVVGRFLFVFWPISSRFGWAVQ